MTRTANGSNSGLGALAQSIAPNRLADDDDKQLELLGFDEQSEGHYARHTIAARRPGGRQPGAIARTSRDLAKLLAHAGHRHPVEFLSAVFSMDTRELAAKLAGDGDKIGLVTFDQARAVLDVQVKAAKEAALYVAQQMPKAVEMRTDAPRAVVVIHEGSAELERSDTRAMSAFEPIELQAEQYQGLSDHDRDKSQEG
jgi:Asp-tRNA(Asn)/Glu-tRNA(Gln) amidotransferase A subunit family amidase